MMTRAYQEIYLNKAQSVLGDAFDYAINACGVPGDNFVKMFLASTVSRRLENGEPAYIAGKSGIEIVAEIVAETMGKELKSDPKDRFDRSREYWIGWAIVYYQWYSCRKYSEIFKAITFTDLQQMYYTLHESDITKFVDIADERVRLFFTDTNLKRIGSAYGCTQAELAKKAEVSLRSIQMYEQRNKDINKASVETVYRLAKALGCSMEDLIEK
jgi:DNA-binding XRE family transcriptional regulator